MQLLGHVVDGAATVAVRALLSFGDRPPRPFEIPSSVAVNQGAGAEELTRITGQPWTPQQSGIIGRWLTQAVSTDAPVIKVVSTARWSGDRLLVPGVNTLGPRTDYGALRPPRAAWWPPPGSPAPYPAVVWPSSRPEEPPAAARAAMALPVRARPAACGRTKRSRNLVAGAIKEQVPVNVGANGGAGESRYCWSL